MAATCVARLEQPSVWTLDVVPDPQSPLATREWPGFTFTRDPASLMVDRKVGMATTLTRQYADAGMTATSVHLVLSVASAVVGRRELMFEADAANAGLNTPYETTLPVPERLLGASAPPVDRPAGAAVAPDVPLAVRRHGRGPPDAGAARPGGHRWSWRGCCRARRARR